MTADTPRLGDAELHDRFARDLRLQNKADQTVSSYRDRVEELAAMYPDTPVGDVTRDHLKGYLEALQDRGVGETSQGIYFAALSSFWDFLLEERLVETNPARRVASRYIDDTGNGRSAGSDWYVPTIAEVRDLVHRTPGARDRAIVTLLAKTGIRNATLRAIRIGDVDLDDRTVDLDADYCRKRQGRLRVWFDIETQRVLRFWLGKRGDYGSADAEAPLFVSKQGGALSGATVLRDVVQRNGARVGLHDPDAEKRSDRLTVHSFRHFFTHALRESGCPDYMIRILRGDSVTDVLDRYTNPDDEDIRAAYEAHVPQLHITGIA